MGSDTLSDALDMSLFFGTPEQQVEFCTALLDTLKKRGVAKLKNHGIPQETIYSLFDWVAHSFPEEKETQLINSGLGSQVLQLVLRREDGSKTSA